MKLLIVSCYINNAHYMELTKKTLDKYLKNTTYDFFCLNDAPDTNSGEENYIRICDMLSGEQNCFERIVEACKQNNFYHIKIPQSIHIKDRANHSAQRHRENFNWFNKNIQSLIPNVQEYDFLCYLDSDAFFIKEIDLEEELKGVDMAGPFILCNHLNPPLYYIHTGLFFINLKTVTNMNEISWTNTLNMDTGSDIANFIKRNPHYKIKKLGEYDGYGDKLYIPNDHTILALDVPEIDKTAQLIDIWFNKHVIHFRAGSCFGVGSLQHRNKDRLFIYNKKMEAFLKYFD
jgi:hypothetical protein